MKKKLFVLVLAVLCMSLLCGCCLSHEWEDATCEDPKTCVKCGEAEGEALGHDWEDATCEAPETCSACGETQGKALGHEWEDATCEAPKTCAECGGTEGEALGHTYGDWALCGDEMTHTCTACGNEEVAEIDRELLGTQWLLGQWTSSYIILPDGEGDFTDYGALFREDGTVVLQLDEDVDGTWVWDEHRVLDDGSECYDFIYCYEEEYYQVTIVIENGERIMVFFLGDIATLFLEK